MFRPISLVYASLCLFAFCMVFMISSCGNSVEKSGAGVAPGVPVTTAHGTGSVAFRIFWQQPSSGANALFTPSFNSCVDHSIGTISATVSDGTTTVASASWPCSAHEGLIITVPTGTNLSVQVNGRVSGSLIWSGSVSPITVTTGQTTDVGTIVMSYVGLDTTQPTVISILQHTWDFGESTSNVPVTDRIIVTFDEPMAISTITTTNITFKLIDDTPVSGVVSYVTASNAAVFTPAATLAYDTQYVLRVLSCVTADCITDTAGNQLAYDYADTFSTESAPVAVPDAPSAVTAKAGNGQILLNWRASNGAASYNIYYGFSPGLTTANGTQIPDVRAPFAHLGRQYDVTLYYIVTAVNSFGESPASAEASATPVFPAGNPLPPAYLSVAPSISQNSITWPAVSGATSYNLYWSTSPIVPDKYSADNVVRGGASPYTHTGITEGLTYCYIVTALNSNGESADSRQSCVGIGSIYLYW